MSAQIYLVTLMVVVLLAIIFSITVTFRVIKNDLRKKIKLDISIEEMLSSEQKIKNFLEYNNIVDDHSIEKIAEILNVEQGGIDDELVEQACLKNKDSRGKKVVVFKRGLSDEEKRFVFVHEIAHLVNGDAIPVTRPDGFNKSKVEQLADYTAAALLMPLEPVYNYLIEHSYKQSLPQKRVVIIHELCKMYDVTEVVALRRVKEVYALKEN